MTNSSFLTTLAGIRDLLLSVGSAMYFLGYVTWSIFVWQYGLGPVPALKSQYFLTGFVVGTVLAIVVASAFLIARVAFRWWPTYLADRTTTMRNTVRITLLLVAVLCTLVASDQILTAQFIRNSASRLSLTAFIAGIALVPFLWVSFFPQQFRRQREQFGAAVLILYLGAVGIATLLAFVNSWYVEWPQELGGGRPRFATLELRISELAPSTIPILAGDTTGAGAIMRSRPVAVLIRTDDSLIISPAPMSGRKQPSHASPYPRLEIPTKAIVSIWWIVGMDRSSV